MNNRPTGMPVENTPGPALPVGAALVASTTGTVGAATGAAEAEGALDAVTVWAAGVVACATGAVVVGAAVGAVESAAEGVVEGVEPVVGAAVPSAGGTVSVLTAVAVGGVLLVGNGRGPADAVPVALASVGCGASGVPGSADVSAAVGVGGATVGLGWATVGDGWGSGAAVGVGRGATVRRSGTTTTVGSGSGTNVVTGGPGSTATVLDGREFGVR